MVALLLGFSGCGAESNSQVLMLDYEYETTVHGNMVYLNVSTVDSIDNLKNLSPVATKLPVRCLLLVFVCGWHQA